MEYHYTATLHAACGVHADGHSVVYTATDRTAWVCGLNALDTLKVNGNAGTATFTYAGIEVPLAGAEVLCSLDCVQFDAVFGGMSREEWRELLRKTIVGFNAAVESEP